MNKEEIIIVNEDTVLHSLKYVIGHLFKKSKNFVKKVVYI